MARAEVHPGLARAKVLLELRRHREAEEELRRALRDLPEDALLHAHLALCLSHDPRRARQAAEAALRATVCDPLQPAAWYALSLVETRHGALDRAEQTGRIALALNAKSVGLQVHLAQVLFHRGRYRDALEPLERALATDPGDVDGLMLAGSTYARLGRHADAKDAFTRAVARAPENAAVQGNAGWAALRRGDAAAALGHFRASLRVDARQPEVQRGLMEALRARNPAYRAFLAAALRFYWVPSAVKWQLVGVCVAVVAWISLAPLPPALVLALQAVAVAAAVATWASRSIADVLLLADPAGRAVLDGAHRFGAVAVTVFALLAAGLAVAWLADGPRGVGFGAILALLYTVPLAALARAEPGRARVGTGIATAAAAVPAVFALVNHVRGDESAGAWFGISVSAMLLVDVLSHEPFGRK